MFGQIDHDFFIESKMEDNKISEISQNDLEEIDEEDTNEEKIQYEG